MYSTAVLCAVMILVSTAASKEVFKLTPEKLAKAQQISAPCEKEHNVDSSIFHKLFSGKLPQDEMGKKYLYCFAFNGGFVEEDGHIVVDKMLSFLGDHPLAEDFKEALSNCNKLTKENHLETVMAMHTCYNNEAPVVFSL